ncbi:hypothetical protein [Streptomyces sp. SPB074]|uniref:hypothetical protein n=1 Tax=Streptomyces sp. (strain SPB074) TaxID=465543 RepID=UPI00017F0E1E|nr:hypothetical protein [Streptomyces sp. SPB074]EDY42848.1 hypothetical protein SSBG_00810 [Streptomyces sp. SPB074]
MWRGVEFRDGLPRTLARGDRLTGVLWRGRLVRADADGVPHESVHGVADQGTAWQSGALMAGPAGLLGIVASVWWLAARGERRHGRAAAIVGWHGVALSVLAFPCGLIQENYDWPLWGIWALWGPLALLGLCTMTAFARDAPRRPRAHRPADPGHAARPPGPA